MEKGFYSSIKKPLQRGATRESRRRKAWRLFTCVLAQEE
jgi:hypothetical protein